MPTARASAVAQGTAVEELVGVAHRGDDGLKALRYGVCVCGRCVAD